MTGDPTIESFAQELAAGLGSALGAGLVALYLYGSSVTGGFDVGVSDLDLLAVTARDISDTDLATVSAFHRAIVELHPEWDDRLEIVYVGRATLAWFRSGGLLGVISPGEPFHVRDGVEQWLQNFYLVRETGATLFGPCPGDLLPNVSWAEFIAATKRYAGEVRGRSLRDATPGARAYAVLTMSRALCTIRSARPCSKQEGADWARSRMPEWGSLLDEAEQCRLSRGRAGFTEEATLTAAEAFIRLLGDEIESAFAVQPAES
jgi:hypothetical protein